MIKNYIKRVQNNKISFCILLIGFVMAFLVISLASSFVGERIKIDNERINNIEPNGRTIQVPSVEDKNLVKNFVKIMSKTKENTGVYMSEIFLQLDDRVNISCPVRFEWFKGENIWHPTIVEGRYFNSQEMNNGKRVAVVGKKRKEDIFEKDGKKYIKLQNIVYEVVGFIGLKGEKSTWDHEIILPFLSAPIEIVESNLSGNDMVMYNNENVIDENIKIIQKEYKKMYGKEAKVNEYGEAIIESEVEKVVVNPNVIFFIALIGYGIALVYAINIVSFWIEKRKKEMCIRKAFGYSNRDILKMIFSEMFLNSLLATLIGLFIQLISYKIVGDNVKYDFNIYPINVLVSCFTIIITGILTSIWPMIKIMKFQVVDGIKE